MILLYEHRRMPQDWNLPLNNNGIPSPTPPQGGQDNRSATSSRSRTPSPTSTSSMSMPTKPPQMHRGVTAPPTYVSPSPSPPSSQTFEPPPVESPRKRKEDLELGQRGVVGASGTSSSRQGGERRPRGRPSALEWSKSLSPKGRLGHLGVRNRSSSVEGVREKDRSASPNKRLVSYFFVCMCMCVSLVGLVLFALFDRASAHTYIYVHIYTYPTSVVSD